jgi:hypothetical protein
MPVLTDMKTSRAMHPSTVSSLKRISTTGLLKSSLCSEAQLAARSMSTVMTTMVACQHTTACHIAVLQPEAARGTN